MSQLKPKPLTLILSALALLIALVLIALFTLPIPRSITINANGANGTIITERGFLPAPGTCTNVRWNVQGISAIYFDGQGTVGEGEQSVCFYPDAVTTLRITFQNNESLDYRVPGLILVNTPAIWFAGLVTLALFITALGVQFAPRASEMQVLGRAAGAITTMLISLLVTFLLLEGGMRLYFQFFGTVRDKLVYMGSAADIIAANRSTMAIPFINYGGVPDVNGINARGFRNPDVASPKPEGVYRILALGGSTTYGHQVEADGAYPALLQTILRDEYGYDNVEVINGGFPNYTSLNSLINFQTRGLEIEPDLVILYQSFNDLAKRWQQPDCFVGQNPLYGFGGDPGTWTEDIGNLNPSTTVRFVQLSFGLIPDPAALESRFELSDRCDTTMTVRNHVDRLEANPPIFFERNVRSLALSAAAHDVDVLLTTQPYNFDMVANADSEADQGLLESVGVGQRQHNALIKQVASETDVNLYDFAADFEAQDKASLWLDVIHLTPEGLQLQAELFATFIDQNQIIPTPTQ